MSLSPQSVCSCQSSAIVALLWSIDVSQRFKCLPPFKGSGASLEILHQICQSGAWNERISGNTVHCAVYDSIGNGCEPSESDFTLPCCPDLFVFLRGCCCTRRGGDVVFWLSGREGGDPRRNFYRFPCKSPGPSRLGRRREGGMMGWRDGTWQVNSLCPPTSSAARGRKCEPTHYLQLCETPSINSVN